MGKMSPEKVRTLLFVMCAMLFFHLASGTYPTCTSKQKNEILVHCRKYIRKDLPIDVEHLDKNSECCEAVREVPNRNMDCIVALLTDSEKKAFVNRRIR